MSAPEVALDRLDVAMLLVGRDLAVVFANRCARSLAAANGSLIVSDGTVRARDADDAAALAKGVRRAADDGTFTLLRLGDRHAWQDVAVAPLEPSARERGDDPVVMLTLGRSRVAAPFALQWFAKIHQLTTAELRVLDLLCSGHSAAEIATIQGVALSTIRTQLASLRCKTATPSIRMLIQRIAVWPPLAALA